MPKFVMIESVDGDNFVVNLDHIVSVQIVHKVHRASVRLADGKIITVADEHMLQLLKVLTA